MMMTNAIPEVGGDDGTGGFSEDEECWSEWRGRDGNKENEDPDWGKEAAVPNDDDAGVNNYIFQG